MSSLLLVLILSQALSANCQTPEDKLKSLGIELPKAQTPVASYVNCVRVGNLLYLSGKGPFRPDGTFMQGKLGKDLGVDSGYYAAKLAAIAHLAVLKEELGSLKRVKKIVKVFGMVNCTANFTEQPQVINGYSDFMISIFGEKGKHARSAVGMCSLPRNYCVEVELIVEVEN